VALDSWRGSGYVCPPERPHRFSTASSLLLSVDVGGFHRREQEIIRSLTLKEIFLLGCYAVWLL
jgi:hypothetical protein